MRRPLRNLAAALILLAQPALADSVTTSAGNGFGRILFTLDSAAHPAASVAAGVLTISFDRKVTIEPASVTQGLNAYLSSARADADGKTFRFALSQDVRLHTSISGTRFAVDLAPPGFSGTPPDLPPPAPAQAAAIDVAKLDALNIRTGAYSSFTRLVFDWPKKIPYTVFPGAGRITIRFEAMANPDFAALKRVAPPWVKEAGWRVENRGLVIDFDTDASSSYHDFRDGTHIVLDILAPKSDAASYNPPGNAKGAKPVALAKAVPAKGDATANAAAQAQAVADAAAKLNGTDQQAATKPPAPLTPPAPVANATPPATETPSQTALAAPDSKEADAQRTKQGATLTFPGAHGAAVFVRGMTAWIVLDGTPNIDPKHLQAALGDLPSSVDVATGNGYSLLRIGLKQAEQISAHVEGANLKVVLAPQVTASATGIGFARNSDDPKRAALTTLVPGAVHTITLSDPVAGDTLVIVPASAGRAVIDPRSYMEFASLPTASGLVLTPYTDDLNVGVRDGRVTVASPAGLALTAPSSPLADSPAELARGGDGPSYLDFVRWSKPQGSFLNQQRRLRAAAAHLKPEEANTARLALARFYIANHFAAEALGLVNLIQASDPSLQDDRQLQTIRAAADFMMARYRDAHNDLAGSAFDGDRHAAFWRGLTEAALENWSDAKKAFAEAEPVLSRYPRDWQTRAHLAEARAAIATGALETADATLSHLPADLPKPLMLDSELAQGQLYAQEGRYRDAARLLAGVEKSGDDRMASLAIYADVNAGLTAGAISPDRAINELEKLRYRWRGDALELKTLRKLGGLYFTRQRWREGLQVLRIATMNFPNDDMAREAQDDMRSAFENLFLKGNADKIPPVEALALFYDFIDLTPIGPNGDDMIRRMADRLVAVDLLEPAATLLKYQVTKRLDGVARAQVATRLAMIDLMDHKPKDALEALRTTQISSLPDDVGHQRLLLEARSLAALKQWDQAIDMIAVDDAPDSRRLRADIYWESGNWAVAAQKSEELLGERWSDAAPLSADDREEIMRAAISYSLASDQTGLNRLRDHFAAKMKSSPDAGAFAVVTQPIDQQGVAFRDMAGQIASVDTLENFMKDFRKQYDVAAATN
jgi:hypothetical protein